MSEALKFTTLDEATAVYPNLPWRRNGDREVFVFDEKKDEYEKVSEGQYIVSIGDRFEVHDKEPAKAHTVEAPSEEEDDEPKKAPSRKANAEPKADEPHAHEAEGIKGPVTRTSEEIE